MYREGDDRLIRKLSVPLAASLRNAQEGDSVYHHRVVGRLVDEDGEVVLLVEGPHDPIEIPPP